MLLYLEINQVKACNSSLRLLWSDLWSDELPVAHPHVGAIPAGLLDLGAV